MKFKRNEKYESISIYAFITICAAVILCLGVVYFKNVRDALSNVFDVISPLTYAFVIAYLLSPLTSFIERKVITFKKSKKDRRKLRRALSILVAYLVVAALLTCIFLLLVPQIANSYNDLSQKIGNYVSGAQEWADNFVRNFPLFNGKYESLSEFMSVTDISASLSSFIANSSSFITDAANYLISSAGHLVVEVKNLVIAVVLAIYFLFSKEQLCGQCKKILSSIFKRKTYINIVNLTRYTHQKFGGFITGKILDAFIIGIITFILMGIFGMPYYPLIALIIGVTDIIPIFGPIIGAIPTGFLVLISDPGKVIWFILLVIAIQQLEGNIISPKILGESTGLSGMWVIIAITFGGGLFGIVGMIASVPAVAVLYALIKQQSEKKLARKGLPGETEYYIADPPRIDFEKENVFIQSDEEIPEAFTADAMKENPVAHEMIEKKNCPCVRKKRRRFARRSKK